MGDIDYDDEENEFVRDMEWQRGVRDRILVPAFYKKYAEEGRYVVIDKGRLATIMQQRYAVDTVVQGKDGNAAFIEEKIVRWPGRTYTAMSLETHSCTVPGYESEGWMMYGASDYLLYCFAQSKDTVTELICYLVDFPKLQAWFLPILDTFPTFGPLKKRNRSKGRVVPLDRIRSAVPTWVRRCVAPAMSEAS